MRSRTSSCLKHDVRHIMCRGLSLSSRAFIGFVSNSIAGPARSARSESGGPNPSAHSSARCVGDAYYEFRFRCQSLSRKENNSDFTAVVVNVVTELLTKSVVEQLTSLNIFSRSFTF